MSETTTTSRKQIIRAMIGAMVSLLLASLDNTIVGTAMPQIIADLHGMEHYSWPFTSYILCSTIAIVIAGKLSDILGRKPIFIFGLISFLIGSILCGLSASMLQLIVFRGLQGIGGGIIISNSFIMVGDFFPPRERGKYMGILASMFGLASVIGPTVGGFITDLVNWRWVFYVNIPLCILSIILIVTQLPRVQRVQGAAIDYLGSITLIAGIVPFLLVFTWGGTLYSWLSPQIIGLAIFSLICLSLFVMVERRASQPILSPSLFKEKIFVSSILIMFLSNAVMFCAIIYIPLFIQGILGISASTSGSIITPMMIGLTVAAIGAGQFVSRTGHYKVLAICGTIINAAGLCWIVTMGADTSIPAILAASAITGFGAGVIIPIYNVISQAAFPHSQLGTVTAAIQFFRNLGAAIGTSLFGYILNLSMKSGFSQLDFSHTPIEMQQTLTNPNILSNRVALQAILQKIPPELQDAFTTTLNLAREVLASSIHHVFLFGVALIVLTLVIILLQKEVPLQKTG